MITLAEVLKKSGWTQEQIDALDAKAREGFNGVLAVAEQAEKDALTKQTEATAAAAKAEADRKAAEAAQVAAKAAQDAAELQKRSVDEFWANTYNPGMAEANAEKARLAKIASDAQAEVAYYKTQRASYLENLGIKPEDAPEYKPAAVIPVTPVTPGTPTLIDPKEFLSRVDKGVYSIQDIAWKYQSLYNGQPLPISPSELVAKADAVKLLPMEWAARTYQFAEKEAERTAAIRKAELDASNAAAVAARDAEHKIEMDKQKAEYDAELRKKSEQFSPNPNVNTPPGSAKFADLRRAQQAGERKDPLTMTPEQRREATRTNIHKVLEEREAAVA